MKIILFIIFVIFLSGCDTKPTMQEIKQAEIAYEIKNAEIQMTMRNKFDDDKMHTEFCNKYGALYYVNYIYNGNYVLVPVLDKDSKVIPCTR